MSVRNINVLQNPIDLAYITSYTNEYLVQSLANLGQRLGIKGDSVKYNYFTFLDLYNNIDVSKYNPKEYIGFIIYGTENNMPICNYGISKKNNGRINNINFSQISEKSTLKSEKNIFSKQFIENDINLDIDINNINKFKYTNIIYKDEYLYSILYGKILNTNDSDNNNVEIIYNKFNTNTGIIEYSVHAFHLYNDGESNHYCMLVLEPDTNNYKLSIWHFNSTLIGDKISKTNFENMFNYSKLDTNNPFYFSEDIDDLDKLFHYNEDYDSTLFGIIKYNKLNNELNYNPNNYVYLDLNTNNNTLFSLSSNNINKNITYINDLLSKQSINLLSRIYFLNNDINVLYPKLIEYYSNTFFNINRSELIKNIFINIYEHLYYNEENLNNEYYTLYIPLDYKLKYFGNESNALQIYNSLDIYLSLVDFSILSSSEVKKILNESNNIIYDYESDEKIINIQYFINYDKKFNEYITNISIETIYTLPYINQNNNWSINNINSNISALGKNAGNPNIIIIYNNNIGNGVIESNIIGSQKIMSLTSLEYVQSNFFINPNITQNPGNYSSIECIASLPKINKASIEYLSDSIIILVSNQNCITNNNVILNEDKELNYITTLWVVDTNKEVDDELDYSQFSCVTNSFLDISNNFAFDLSSLLNINNILSNLSANIFTQNESFDNLVFNINKNTLLQSDTDYNTSKCIIYNSEYSDYVKNIETILNNYKDNPEISSNISDYKNSLSLLVKYNNDVNYNINSNTYDFNHTSKYISDNNKVVNSLYPIISKVNVSSGEISYTYYTYNTWAINDNNYTTIDEIISLNSVYEKLNYTISYTSDGKPEFITVSGVSSYTTVNTYEYIVGENIDGTDYYFYNEYTFANDVPQIDFKEVLLLNTNVMNRINILSLDKKGDIDSTIYYSYFGSRYDIKSDKSHLVIGSSYSNINLGTETLISSQKSRSLNKQDVLDIDFDSINLNGNINNEKIAITNDVIKIKESNGQKFYIIDNECFGNCGYNLNVKKADSQSLFDVRFSYSYINVNGEEKSSSVYLRNEVSNKNYTLYFNKYDEYEVTGERYNTKDKTDIKIKVITSEKNLRELNTLTNYREYEFMRFSLVPMENSNNILGSFISDYGTLFVNFLNLNKLLDKYFLRIFGITIGDIEFEKLYINKIIDGVSTETLKNHKKNTTANSNVHKYFYDHDKFDNKNYYLIELPTRNTGKLEYIPSNRKDAYNVQNIILGANIKFVIYFMDDKYYIDIIFDKNYQNIISNYSTDLD